MLLSSGEVDDTVRYCSYLIASGQHQRAARHLRDSAHLDHSAGIRYLLAVCLAESKAWDEVITLLQQHSSQRKEADEESVTSQLLGNVESAAHVLQGTAYEALGSISDAVNCYRRALISDVFCVEALERVYALQALSAEEEKSFLSVLPYGKQCSVEEEHMVKYLYQSKLHHEQLKFSPGPYDPLSPLAASVDVLCSRADHFLKSLKVEQCYAATSSLLLREPLHPHATLLHIACCVNKGSAKELYSLGHKLVHTLPGSPLAWYTVGCYYLSTNRHVEARRYLVKALTFSPLFSPAHVAFGTSFAMEGEHDQAIAAFSNAARCMPGSPLPLLCLGKEYFVSGSLTVACSFLKNSLALAPSDPVILQEVGVVLAITGYCSKAEKYLSHAVAILRSVDPRGTLPIWEPISNNLGHVLRKQGKLKLALDAHNQALQVDPCQPNTLTAIAFVHLLQEEYDSAVEFCQRSLLLRREDQFTVEVMQIAVNQLASIPPLPTSPPPSLDQLLQEPITPPVASTLPMQTD